MLNSFSPPLGSGLQAAHSLGYHAGFKGIPVSENPYSESDLPISRVAWAHGWKVGDKARAQYDFDHDTTGISELYEPRD